MRSNKNPLYTTASKAPAKRELKKKKQKVVKEGCEDTKLLHAESAPGCNHYGAARAYP